ncbi:SPT3 Dosage dependent suppressor of Ty-induced promoter mutations-like protein [Metarhizium acridum]|nr:SPT3 Dosage dependent suppressor of Ty-induced promoter mutations-like protein [Metarhizium acridum]
MTSWIPADALVQSFPLAICKSMLPCELHAIAGITAKRWASIIFTIEDFQGRVVAQAMSNPIMITDDNKVHLIVQVSHPQVSETVTSTTTPLRLPQAMNGNDGVPSISQSHGTSTEIPERLVYMVSRLQANGPVLCFIRR